MSNIQHFKSSIGDRASALATSLIAVIFMKKLTHSASGQPVNPEDIPFYQGLNAFYESKSFKENPFVNGTHEHGEWLKGWTEDFYSSLKSSILCLDDELQGDRLVGQSIFDVYGIDTHNMEEHIEFALSHTRYQRIEICDRPLLV